MNAVTQRFVLFTAFLAVSTSAFSAGATSDISAPSSRRQTVEMVAALVEKKPSADVPKSLNNLFDPEAFGKPDADELRAIAAAQAAEAAALNKSKPANDSDLLELIAEKVVPSGTLTLNNEPLLIFGQKRLRVGDRLTITYDSVDYTVEIASIQRFTFTLRLNRAEVTRRINPGKNP